DFILEWRAFSFTADELLKHGYVILFALLVPLRRLPALAAERWLAYVWLAMALLSVRHMHVFAVVSAPLFACALASWLRRIPGAKRLGGESRNMHQALAGIASPLNVIAALITAAALCWLPTRHAAHAYGHETLAAPTLREELGFLAQRYPDARVFTHFNLGGIVLWETRGRVPVFV